MAEKISMRVQFRKVPGSNDLFEFAIITPLLRTQFRIPRAIVNRLRVDMEKAILQKPQ